MQFPTTKPLKTILLATLLGAVMTVPSLAVTTIIEAGSSSTARLIDPATEDGDLDIYNEGPSRVIVTVCNPGKPCAEFRIGAGDKASAITVRKGGHVTVSLPAGTKKATIDWDF